jgi:hypothetical protein
VLCDLIVAFAVSDLSELLTDIDRQLRAPDSYLPANKFPQNVRTILRYPPFHETDAAFLALTCNKLGQIGLRMVLESVAYNFPVCRCGHETPVFAHCSLDLIAILQCGQTRWCIQMSPM